MQEHALPGEVLVLCGPTMTSTLCPVSLTPAVPTVNGASVEPRRNILLARHANPIPKTGNPQNKSKLSGIFSSAEKRHPVYQTCHALHHKLTTKTPRPAALFCENPSKNGHPPRLKNYCKSVPSSGCALASSGGITTAAATLSWSSRSSSFTPIVLRPAARIDLVSMRIILPN